MPKPRYAQILLDSTPYYYCVSRCVRRAFLCGEDPVTAWSYEHRCQWTEDRLHGLARIFAIELCGYVAMSNHYHVVLYVDREAATAWSLDDVIEQSHQLFSGNLLSRRYQRGETFSASESSTLSVCGDMARAADGY